MAEKLIKLEELDKIVKKLWEKISSTFARNKKYSIFSVTGGDYTLSQMNSKVSGGSFLAFATDVYNNKVLKLESITYNGETTRNVSVCCQGNSASTVTKITINVWDAMINFNRTATGWHVDRDEIMLT